MEKTRNILLVATALLLTAVVAGGLTGVAAADHGSPADFEVSPETTDDRSPGASDLTYEMSSAGADAFESERGLEIVDFYWIESEQVDFSACDPDDARVFGIDRGNNNTGTQTDADLLQHMKDYEIDGSRIALEIYDEGDLGGDPIHLNAPDATVAVLANCVENTGSQGWYQFQGYVNGTTYEGGYEEVYLESHYFWVGDFEGESEARDELGPPPSADGGSNGGGMPTPAPGPPAPTATPSDGGTPSSGETPPSGGTPSADIGGEETSNDQEDRGGGATSDADASTPTSDQNGAGDAGSGGPGSGDDDRSDDTRSADRSGNGGTPTLGNGAGFGPVVALFAVAAATLLVRRR